MKESVAVAKEADAKKGVSSTRSDNSILRVRDESERQLGSLRGVIGNITREGSTPSVDSIAAQLSSMHTAQRAPVLLALQQTHGNRYVQRVVVGIQAKLVVGQPGDKYEQEADRVAEAVMRMPEPKVRRQPLSEEEEIMQSKLPPKQITSFVQRQPEHDEKEEESFQSRFRNDLYQTRIYTDNSAPEAAPTVNAEVPPIVHEVLNSPGQPLDPNVRTYMEWRFGQDFSGVRVHTGAKAAESAQAVNALAYTIGRDVAFGAGQYTPRTTTGKKLLAHELTHVLQQEGLDLPSKMSTIASQSNKASEVEADTASKSVVAGLSPPPIMSLPVSRLQRCVVVGPAPPCNATTNLPLSNVNTNPFYLGIYSCAFEAPIGKIITISTTIITTMTSPMPAKYSVQLMRCAGVDLPLGFARETSPGSKSLHHTTTSSNPTIASTDWYYLRFRNRSLPRSISVEFSIDVI